MSSGPRAEWVTPKEELVLEQLLHGFSNKVIARNVGIMEATVKVHIKSIFRKLDVGNRTQVAIRVLTMRSESLIKDLPEDHPGRYEWLASYGTKPKDDHVLSNILEKFRHHVWTAEERAAQRESWVIDGLILMDPKLTREQAGERIRRGLNGS